MQDDDDHARVGTETSSAVYLSRRLLFLFSINLVGGIFSSTLPFVR